MRFYYGTFKSGSKTDVKFFLKNEGEFNQFKDHVHSIINLNTIEGTGKDANDVFIDFVDKTKNGIPILAGTHSEVKNEPTFRAGAVGIYQDDFGGHHCLIVMPGYTKSGMIFLTSNNRWNPRARSATEEERSLLGRPDWGYDNYLAPVIRHNADFEQDDYYFPEHRVVELIKEFWPHLVEKQGVERLMKNE